MKFDFGDTILDTTSGRQGVILCFGAWLGTQWAFVSFAPGEEEWLVEDNLTLVEGTLGPTDPRNPTPPASSSL